MIRGQKSSSLTGKRRYTLRSSRRFTYFAFLLIIPSYAHVPTVPAHPFILDPVYSDAGDRPDHFAVGDLNGDGFPELITQTEDIPSGDKFLTILINKGNGTYKRPKYYAYNSDIGWMAVGHLNNDGNLDLVVTNTSDMSCSVFLGNGDGTFQPHYKYSIYGSSPKFVALGDLNGDEVLDFATSNYSSDNISVLLGNGDGTFQPATTDASGGGMPYSLAMGDLNDDEKADIVVVNTQYLYSVSVLLGNGDGTFQTAYTVNEDRQKYVAIDDLDGDEALDLVLSGQDDIEVLLGNGDGTFQTAASYSAGDSWHVAIGDMNGDSALDLAVTDYDQQPIAASLFILFGNGDGTFQPAVPFAAGDRCRQVVIGDLYEDGFPDLAILHLFLSEDPGSISVHINSTTCIDLDSDGYGDPACAACPYHKRDCDEANPDVNPGVKEIHNGIDDDCDGFIDDFGIPWIYPLILD